MAKVKIKGIPELNRKINKVFGKVVESQQMNDDIGVFLTERIRGEGRRARPLNNSRSYRELKSSTIGQREVLGGLNPTHPAFKPSRSNLTLTGQLADALSYKKLPGGGILIFMADTLRKPYYTGKENSEPVKTNREVDRDLRKIGFFFYTAKGIDSEPRIIKRINNIAKKFVRRAIKINFGS